MGSVGGVGKIRKDSRFEEARPIDIDAVVAGLDRIFNDGRSLPWLKSYVEDRKKDRLSGKRPVSLVGDSFDDCGYSYRLGTVLGWPSSWATARPSTTSSGSSPSGPGSWAATPRTRSSSSFLIDEFYLYRAVCRHAAGQPEDPQPCQGCQNLRQSGRRPEEWESQPGSASGGPS